MPSEVNKLVFVGDMGAGKTTAIRSISDIEPVSTDMPISEEVRGDKTETTVALDYSSVELEDGELLHVYGVPGQKYLDFMWPLVCIGAIGIIVLVPADGEEIVERAHMLLTEFGQIAPEACFAVGVTMTDKLDTFGFAAFRDALAERGHRLPVMKVDAREEIQVDFLVKALLSYRQAESITG